MLLCTVRGCCLPLIDDAPARSGRHATSSRLVCAAGHSFDRSRDGYVNLLQPQDRRSRNPGDSKAAVQARRRLHDRGVASVTYQGIATSLAPKQGEVLLDVGCGEGFYAGSLARDFQIDAHGTDLSVFAIQAAAKRYKSCGWVVANADRFLPYADHSFDIVSSITARLHPTDFRRILRPEGRLLVAVPAPEDLMELRGVSATQPLEPARIGPDRVPRVLAELADGFELVVRERITTREDLDAPAVADLLLTIYRPHRAAEPMATTLTFSLDLLLFRPRQP
jgi:23S rRNA (guanine745-N1)-methyltransferase